MIVLIPADISHLITAFSFFITTGGRHSFLISYIMKKLLHGGV